MVGVAAVGVAFVVSQDCVGGDLVVVTPSAFVVSVALVVPAVASVGVDPSAGVVIAPVGCADAVVPTVSPVVGAADAVEADVVAPDAVVPADVVASDGVEADVVEAAVVSSDSPWHMFCTHFWPGLQFEQGLPCSYGFWLTTLPLKRKKSIIDSGYIQQRKVGI